MSKKPIVDMTPDVIIRIQGNDVHIGHPEHTSGFKAGTVLNLTKEFGGDAATARTTADILIARGLAVPADGSSFAKAVKQGKESFENAMRNAQKKRAETAQMQFDDLPKEIRALAGEYGDEVIDMFQSGESVEDIVRAYSRH